MKKIIAPSILIALTSLSCTSTEDNPQSCLFSFIEKKGDTEYIGFKNANSIIIKPLYLIAQADTFCHMNMVLHPDQGWIAIDTEGRTILVPYMFDNGPDYVEEGVFRFVENNKIGFADTTGRQVLPAIYDFVTPFSDGYAEYFIGGEPVYDDGRSRTQILAQEGHDGLIDRHWTWGGDIKEHGYINHKGEKFKSKPSSLNLNHD